MQVQPFARTKKFLLPLQVKMNIVGLKLEKLLKIMGIGLLIGIGLVSSIQVGHACEKSKCVITCEGADLVDTIIVTPERSRVRVYLDMFKKLMFVSTTIPNSSIDFQPISSNGLKHLFVNVYQRNVFYVYASSTVP
jgi:hypothetical protein